MIIPLHRHRRPIDRQMRMARRVAVTGSIGDPATRTRRFFLLTRAILSEDPRRLGDMIDIVEDARTAHGSTDSEFVEALCSVIIAQLYGEALETAGPAVRSLV